MGPHKHGNSPVHKEVIQRRANTGQEEALPQGAVNELHPHEGEHTKNRDKYQHQRNADGDHPLLSSFASDVPRHAVQCNRARGGSGKEEAPREGVSPGLSGLPDKAEAPLRGLRLPYPASCWGRTWRGLTQLANRARDEMFQNDTKT